MSSDILQLAACILLPVGVVLFLSVFFGWIGAIGGALIIGSVLLWFIGREISLANQRAEAEKEYRAQLTGWTDEERQRLGSTNG